MNRLADTICLIKLLARHNDPADDFNMDEHQRNKENIAQPSAQDDPKVI